MPSERPSELNEMAQPEAPVLGYRSPAEDAPAASAADVIRGGLAAVIGVWCLVTAGVVFFGTMRRWDEPWKPYAAILCVLMLIGGALASLRSARYYFSGRNRIRRRR